jgi:hypothetical protein
MIGHTERLKAWKHLLLKILSLRRLRHLRPILGQALVTFESDHRRVLNPSGGAAMIFEHMISSILGKYLQRFNNVFHFRMIYHWFLTFYTFPLLH